MTEPKKFKPQAIIFDKDGTLIDFDAMWGGWTVYLAEELHKASGLQVREALSTAFGYDEKSKKVLAHGKLASNPMSVLYELTVDVIASLGVSTLDARNIVEEAWCIPDPIILAKPFTDLRTLFSQLQQQGIKIAIATADDRAPTQAMIEAFDVEDFIACMVCADDGIPSKPNPDMALHLCQQMDVDISKTIIVGDTTSDLKMAHASNAGMAVGVLSGVSSARDLVEHADVLIGSIDELYEYVIEFSESAHQQTNNGLNPDFAY